MQAGRQLAPRHPLLLGAVAEPQRHRVVRHGVVVDGHAVGGADLVLPPVAAPDRPALVVERGERLAQLRLDLARALGEPVLLHQREHAHGDRRHARMEAQHHAALAADLVLVVAVHQRHQHRPGQPDRGLDNERHVALARALVQVGQVLAGEFHVPLQVEVGAIVDALQLLPAEREPVLDVVRVARVVRQLVRPVLVEAQVVGVDAQVQVVLEAARLPMLEPARVLARVHEVLHLHLLELAGAEDEALGGDLVAERLAHLRDAERHLEAARLQHVLEVHVAALRGLRAQVDHAAGVLHRAEVGAEHQVELPRRGQLPLAALRAAALGIVELVGAKARLAGAAVDQRIGEVLHVAGGFPHPRVHQDGGVDAHDVVVQLRHLAPPRVAQPVLEGGAERPVVPRRGEPAVHVARRKMKPRRLHSATIVSIDTAGAVTPVAATSVFLRGRPQGSERARQATAQALFAEQPQRTEQGRRHLAAGGCHSNGHHQVSKLHALGARQLA